MRKRTKALVAGMAIASALAVLAGTTDARRIEVSRQWWRKIWSRLIIVIAGHVIECPVTLEGSYHSRTISKVCGQLIGSVTKAFIRGSACTGGSMRALTETLPWHVQYLGFIGRLPSIPGFRSIFIGWAFSVVNAEGIACLFGTTQANPAGAIENIEGGVARTSRMDESLSIPVGGEFLCAFAGEASFSGTAEVFVEGSTTTRITVRLVQ
jgi:hypothetical protein